MLRCVGSSYESITSWVYPTLVLHSKSASSWQLSTKPHCADLPHRVRVPHYAPAHQHVSSRVSKEEWFHFTMPDPILSRDQLKTSASHGVSQHPRHPSALKWQTRPLLIQFFHSFTHLPRVSNLLPHTTPLWALKARTSVTGVLGSHNGPQSGVRRALHADVLPTHLLRWLSLSSKPPFHVILATELSSNSIGKITLSMSVLRSLPSNNLPHCNFASSFTELIPRGH